MSAQETHKQAVCQVVALGRMHYAEAWALQNTLAEARGRDDIPDRLLLVEHPHTYTFGSAVHEENLLLDSDQLRARGIAVFHSDRGGDITYHGPGQLVGYPILKLASAHGALRADVLAYVRALETVIIRALADFDVTAGVIPGLTGVWVGEAKIAAIGVRVTTRTVTKHGFAINLNTDLSYFDGIIPCGIHDKDVTSLAQLQGAPADAAGFTTALVSHFGTIFDRSMQH
ncbi:MAG: lipoyl(octanoyl) transferase LipB [Anaerolineae bacterium]|nr:lipoyl(octanoyl) transferase LipB [Anaerolineae bacterium]